MFLTFWLWKNLDLDAEPDPDLYWPKMLYPDPYLDQYGSKTLIFNMKSSLSAQKWPLNTVLWIQNY